MKDRGLRFKGMARGRGMLPLPSGESQGENHNDEKSFLAASCVRDRAENFH